MVFTPAARPLKVWVKTVVALVPAQSWSRAVTRMVASGPGWKSSASEIVTEEPPPVTKRPAPL